MGDIGAVQNRYEVLAVREDEDRRERAATDDGVTEESQLRVPDLDPMPVPAREPMPRPTAQVPDPVSQPPGVR
jgi:hypothetical protein